MSAPRTPGQSSKVWLRSGIRRALIEAFLAANEGWSSDRVIVDPELNERFAAECDDLGLPGGPADWNRALMRLRKAGHLKGLPQPRRTTFPEPILDQYLFASEIALRQLADRTSLSLDEVLCDPEEARQLDAVAGAFAPGFSPLHYRWAALTIRKRAHHCRQSAQRLPSAWERRCFPGFRTLRRLELDRLSGSPGVYLARQGKDRNLYAGETGDLGKRLRQHREAEGWRGIADDPEVGVLELGDVDARDRWGLQSRLIRTYSPAFNYLDLGSSDAAR
jgi:site-specific DNA-methyltransferase (adenine-specific)